RRVPPRAASGHASTSPRQCGRGGRRSARNGLRSCPSGLVGGVGRWGRRRRNDVRRTTPMRLQRKYHKRHRYPRTALVAGAFFALAALVWMVVGVPTFVKYPTDLDATPRYEGTFTVLVDATTAAPRAEPMELPLTVERHIEALDGDEETAGVSSGATRVVVRETIDLQAGDLLAATQVSQYVMDRSTLENV